MVTELPETAASASDWVIVIHHCLKASVPNYSAWSQWISSDQVDVQPLISWNRDNSTSQVTQLHLSDHSQPVQAWLCTFVWVCESVFHL